MTTGLTIEDLYIDEYYSAKRRARELGQDGGDFYEVIADEALIHFSREDAEGIVASEARDTERRLEL
jgi:hypothetical protein